MLDIKTVVSKFPAHIQERYDFSRAVYHGALTPIAGIVCAVHGEFRQYAAQLRKDGAGCPTCGAEARADSRRASLEEFTARAIQLHRGKYSYAKVQYRTALEHVIVTCPDHGDFPITPAKHINTGQGCPKCAELTRGKHKPGTNTGALAGAVQIAKFSALFVPRATQTHGDTYDYSKVVYKGAQEKIEIVCPTHGAFWQSPEHHIKRAYGCPACSPQKSKAEDQIAGWLSMFTSVVQRDRNVIKPRELDIYLPDRNLAVEYCGMYWHAQFSVEDENKGKNRHFTKYQEARAAGVRVITIYESEWQQRQPQIRRLLRNAVGKSKGKLMARKCELRQVTKEEATTFFGRYHPQGGSGHGTHYGLYWNSKLVACMRFVFGVNDRGAGAANASWTLGRYATRVTVSGAASRLFKAFVVDKKPTEVKSFSDNRYFGGAMYEQLGFTMEEELPPDYQVWSQKIGLRPKPHYQRRFLQARLRDHGFDEVFDPATDTRTEREMTYHMGAGRIYDCGKKRWVWTAPVQVQ